MESIETMSVFVDVEGKFDAPKPEPERRAESVQTCKFCLAPQSAARLTRRDLAAFYCLFRACGLGIDVIELASGYYMPVCQYCWVRACQCVRFIECARKAEYLLSNILSNEPITEEKLSKVSGSYFTPPVQLSIHSLKTYRTNFKSKRKKKKRHISSTEDTSNHGTEGISDPRNDELVCDDSINDDPIHFPVNSDPKEVQSFELENVSVKNDPEIIDPMNAEEELEDRLLEDIELLEKCRLRNKTENPKVKKEKNVKEKRRKKEDKVMRSQKKPRKDPAELQARWKRLEVEVMKLSVEEQLAELERRRSSPRYLQWRHKCDKCAVGFHELVSLERHNLSHHQSRGQYECQICLVRFAKQHQLSSHGGGHRRRWRCLRCGEVILKNDYLEAHRAKCTGSPPIRCDACGKFFSNKLRLRQHVSSSHNARRRHICDVCGREFKAKHHIRYHMRIHTGEMPYQCQLCGKKSSTSTSHRIHMTVHNKKTDDPEAYCVECNKYFKNKNILHIHYQRSLKHNTKDSFQHACTECEERYPAAAALRIHINSAHLKTRSFQCALCDKAYYSQGTLAVHVKDKHVGRERSREHACSICKRAFLTSSQLKAHTRIHTKERPYVCPLCPATFTFNSGLYTHTKNKHKMTTAELKSRLGLASLGTPRTQQQLLQRQLLQRQQLHQHADPTHTQPRV